MSDFEKIELDPHTAEVRFDRSEFAQVIFHQVAETYPTSTSVVCHYTLTPSLTPSGRDWVGLYKVGWSSPRDYICFLWAPLPEGLIPGSGQELKNHVTFQANSLPQDDGEFYQFCYVTSSGQVRGASTPFQFKFPGADDYVEEEDEDEDMMVIKSRTFALQEQLDKTTSEKTQLTQRLSSLQEEHDSLLSKLVELERNLSSETKDHAATKTQLQEATDRVESLQREAHDMILLHDNLREKMSTLNQEKESILKRLEENEVYLNSLQDKIKTLINDKDALMGRNKTLEQEKDLYKNHFTSSESSVQGYVKEVDHLKKWLAEQEAVVADQAKQISTLTSDLNKERQVLKTRINASKTDQVVIGELKEKLHNAEDKLSAAERCRELLKEEVLAAQQVHSKISSDLESSKSAAHSLEIKLAKISAARTEDQNIQRELEGKLKETLEANLRLTGELSSLCERASCSEEKAAADQGSLFALQTAQTHLKERYAKMKAVNEEQQKQLDELLRKQKIMGQTETDLRNEIRDLKERLSMGAEEYKAKYLECRKLATELRRLNKSARHSSEKREMDDKGSETEEFQMSADKGTKPHMGEDQDADTQTEDVASLSRSASEEPECTALSEDHDTISKVMTLSPEELASQLEELGRELSSRRAKKQHYKALYAEEREKRNFLQRHYHEELARKDEVLRQRDVEIVQLKHQLDTRNVDADTRIKQLQAMIDSQNKELVKLRSKTQNQTAATSQWPQYALTYHNPQHSAAPYPDLFPNPYAPVVSPDTPNDMHALPSQAKTPTAPQFPNPYNDYNPPPVLTNASCDVMPPTNTTCGVVAHASAPSVVQDASDGEFQDTVAELDPLLQNEDLSQNLEPPLTPLPPPIQPDVLPSAKIAKVKAKMAEGLTGSAVYGACGMLDDLGPTEVIVEPAGASAPSPALQSVRPPPPPESLDGEDDRFHDADGEPQQLCPVCNITFPPEMQQHDMEIHVERHYNKQTCPMCDQVFDSATMEEFEQHVQSHFDDSN